MIGNKFTLVTDHEPIKWILSTEKLSGKLARWALQLQEFDFKVEHRAGAENGNADCLSRFSVVSIGGPEVPDWERGDITFRPETLLAMMALGVGEQEKVDENTVAASGEVWVDKHLQEYLQAGKHSEEWDALERDRVYRRGIKYRWLGTSLYKVGEKRRMLVIPRPPEREGLVKKVHEEMGHFGVMRVADLLGKTYCWRGMVEMVVKVVK